MDSNGNEGLGSRRDTHYAIFEPEAQVVRKIFNDVASGKPLGQVTAELTKEQVEVQKRFVLDMATQLKNAGKLRNVPFEVKMQIIKLVVNQIIVDTRAQSIRIEGAISEMYALVSIAGTNKSEVIQIQQEAMASHTAPLAIMNNRIRLQA
ncbi:MAG: hypothetical protein ABI690_34180 [Chloroflexota bacterium]